METNQIKALKFLSLLILEAVQESADSVLGGVPNGHIYAAVMNKISFDDNSTLINFNAFIFL